MGREEPIEVPADVVAELVEVFASWRDLRREDKRALLRDYRAEVVVESVGGRRSGLYRVDRVRLGVLPPDVWLYKKMKRLGIE